MATIRRYIHRWNRLRTGTFLFFIARYVAASPPQTDCHRGKGRQLEHREPPFHIEALQALRQLTFAGITHKDLL